MDQSLLDQLPPDVARELTERLGSEDGDAVTIARTLATFHAEGRLGTEQLCVAIGALQVDLPAGNGEPDPIVLALIGRGAMGEVHLARDDRLSRHVAIKRMARDRDDPDARQQFQQEARIVAQLDHPSVPPVYAVETGPDGIVGYSMKLVRGQTLRAYLDATRAAHEAGRKPDDDHALPARLDVFVKVCDAVHYAHSRGVLHRDLKPANIMIGAFGEVLVMDWGLARLVGRGPSRSDGLQSRDDAETVVASVIGTPSYMSPEQANGGESTLDARSDQYSLGLLLQELVTLDKAVSGTTVMALYRTSRAERDPVKHAFGERVPRELAAIVNKATKLDRRQRYASVDAMAEDVRRYLRDEPVLAEPDGLFQRATRWVGRHRATTLAMILGLLLVLGGIVIAGAVGTAVVVEATRWRLAKRHEAVGAVVSAVSTHSRRIDASFQRYEGLLTGLAFAADHALRSEPPAGARFVHPGDLEATGTLVPSPGYDDEPISVVWPIAHYAPGTDPAVADPAALRLAGLQPELERVIYASDPEELPTLDHYRARIVAEGAPIVWAYVALEDGVMFVWPGATDYPEDYDARDQDWYKGAAGRRRTTWDPASRDPSDPEEVGLLVTAMVGLWDGDRQIGVAALDVSIDHVLDELLAPAGLSAPVDTWLVDAEGRTIATSTSREHDPPPFPFDGVLAEVAAGRGSGTTTVDGPSGARMITWAHLDALDWTYAVVGDASDLVGYW